jgi:hypothetical protein
MDIMKIRALIITLVLCTAVSVQAENLLLNPDFEQGNTGWFGDGVGGDPNPTLNIPGWHFWGTDGWCHNNAGMTIGNRAILIWTDAPGVYQDIAVNEGTEYSFSVAAISSSNDANGIHGRDGVFTVEWFDVDGYKIIEPSQEIGRFYGGLRDKEPIDAYNTWKVISGKLTAPSPAVLCRIFLHLAYNAGADNGCGGSLNFDSVFAGTGPVCGITNLKGDLNNDCYINFSDFALMAENWLKCSDVFNTNCQ